MKSENVNNQISDVEKSIIEFIEKYDENDYMNFLKSDDELEKIEALIDTSSNIVAWYDFNKDSNILEFDANFGEITKSLVTKLSNVVAIEKSKEKANVITKRIKNNNLSVFTSTTELNEKFDYILLRNLEDLESVKKFLKEDGTILLIFDNKFGISNFATNNKFKNVCEEKSGLYSKKEIEEYLNANGFFDYNFFYPLPNYKSTNVVFSDKYLPNYHTTKIMNNRIMGKDNYLTFNELNALKQLTKDDKFKEFTNSYLVEINPKSKVKFVGFNNARNKEYRLCTKIYDEIVTKESTCVESNSHINNIKDNIMNLKKYGFNIVDEYKNEKIVSKYVSSKTFYQLIIDNIINQKIDEAYFLITKWFEYIKTKFEQSEDKTIYADLVFENTFYIDNEFYFFDQEWCIYDAPLEFILYRAISNIFAYNYEINKIITQNEFLEHFDLLKNIDLFHNIEKEFQRKIIDSNSYKFYNSQEKVIDIDSLINNSKESLINELQSELALYKCENVKKEEYIKKIYEEKENVISELNLYKEENTKKEKYILSLQEEIREKSQDINDFEKIINTLKEEINKLEGIINSKEEVIKEFENMKMVKLIKKLKK